MFLNYASLSSFENFIFNENIFLYAFGNALSGSHKIVSLKENDFEKLEWLINKKSEYSSSSKEASFNSEMEIILEKINSTTNPNTNNSVWNKYSAKEIVDNKELRKLYLSPQNIDSFLEHFFCREIDKNIKKWLQSPNFLNDCSFGERLSFLSKSSFIINRVELNDFFNLYHQVDNIYEKSIWAGIILEMSWLSLIKNKKKKDATELFNH